MTIKLENRLAQVLGYIPNEDITIQEPTNPSLDFGFPKECLIYSDIVEPQFIGDTMSPVMRIIPLDSDSFTDYKTFTNECFLQLAKYRFQTINIELRDRNAHLLPFKDGQSATLLLHFMKKN